MNDHINFLQGFIKNPFQVGAISPSSPELALAMIEGVKPDKNNIVLEIGLGTGAITKFIKDILPDYDSYLGIEIDTDFVRGLQADYPLLNIICGDACDAERIHIESGLGKIGYIISGLPFVSLPKPVSDGILAQADKFLEKGCMFRTFQYVHGYHLPPAVKFRKRMEARYGKTMRSPVVIKNIPPAYTLTWSTL